MFDILPKSNMRKTLMNVYLDILNNYLSLEVYAEHNGLTIQQAIALKQLAKMVYESDHPEA